MQREETDRNKHKRSHSETAAHPQQQGRCERCLKLSFGQTCNVLYLESREGICASERSMAVIQPLTLLMWDQALGRPEGKTNGIYLPVNSPKNFLQTSRRRGRMFNFNSSLVRWMPSSSRVLGRVVSTSPTTCKATSPTLSFAVGLRARHSHHHPQGF